MLIGSDDAGLARLDRWYRSNVTGSGPLGQTRLDSRWYAVALDIGLYSARR